jgi:hypothetical protein
MQILAKALLKGSCRSFDHILVHLGWRILSARYQCFGLNRARRHDWSGGAFLIHADALMNLPIKGRRLSARLAPLQFPHRRKLVARIFIPHKTDSCSSAAHSSHDRAIVADIKHSSVREVPRPRDVRALYAKCMAFSGSDAGCHLHEDRAGNRDWSGAQCHS